MYSSQGWDSDTYACPDWYTTMQAARYLGVPPWDLLEQPIYWRHKAIIAMNAEAGAQKSIQEHHQSKGR